MSGAHLRMDEGMEHLSGRGDLLGLLSAPADGDAAEIAKLLSDPELEDRMCEILTAAFTLARFVTPEAAIMAGYPAGASAIGYAHCILVEPRGRVLADAVMTGLGSVHSPWPAHLLVSVGAAHRTLFHH